MRKRYGINNDWQFSKAFDDNMLNGVQSPNWQKVRLPHSVVETPYNYFSEGLYQGVWGYGRNLCAPTESMLSWQWILCFEGAAHAAKVYLDGVEIGAHIGGYTAFEIPLPAAFSEGHNHWLSVSLDSSEQLNCPPFGHVIDYMTYGGLYREVYLERRPAHGIIESYAYGKDLLSDNPQLVLEIRKHNIPEANDSDGPGNSLSDYAIELELLELPRVSSLQEFIASEGIDQGDLNVTLKTTVPWKANAGEKTALSVPLPGLAGEGWLLWDIDCPQRYLLKVAVKCGAVVVDQYPVEIGFRKAQFTAKGFFLNGKKVKLNGINRHQSYAYVGYAMPRGPQWEDAHIIKHQLGMNAVRTAHYPQSHHFIRACDALGLLVFTEIPGWQHIGDALWQERALHMVEEMVVDYRHHPSIVLWGVRINESIDLETLYRKTNDLARKHDATRQTAGVRYLRNSQFLEDVYTFNDFSYNAVSKGQKGILSRKQVTGHGDAGYLVSEYNGHMYPAKSFDTIKVRAEHARRHAHVLSAIGAEEGVAGGFAWCLFDYNTHKDFGSGDGICHHGILDMFRNEKLAASVYSSQKPLAKGLVLAVDSELHIGDYPGGAMGPISIYTNGDGINLYKNGHLVGTYHRDENGKSPYRGLDNPPVVLQDLVGDALAKGEGISSATAERIKRLLIAGAYYGQDNLPLWAWALAARLVLFENFKLSDGLKFYSKYIGNWGDEKTQYVFEALKGDAPIGSITMGSSSEVKLEITVDRTDLIEGEVYDVACVRFVSVDANGMRLPYDQGVVDLRVEGPLEIIGPKSVALQGGMGGTYIRTKYGQSIESGQSGESGEGCKSGQRLRGKLFVQRSGLAAQIIEMTVAGSEDVSEGSLSDVMGRN